MVSQEVWNTLFGWLTGKQCMIPEGCNPPVTGGAFLRAPDCSDLCNSLLYLQERGSRMEKVIVAAMSENRVIGKDGGIPWHYPEDLKHFRETTMNHPVVMGSNTYRSLPDDYQPLPGRKNIVLTRSEMDVPESVELANSLDEAWSLAEETGKDTVFITGGASVYEQTLEDADRMILTEIHEEYDGDTHFPEWSEDVWEEVERDDRDQLSFVEYKRRK